MLSSVRRAWDHDVCVNSIGSGDVWEDVLRAVAVWSVRVDVRAERLERVCKRWKHFWQVALGVFSIDLYADRIPRALKPRDVNNRRNKLKQQWLVDQFRVGVLHGHREVRATNVPVVELAPFLASWRE
tara:strand:- start:89 stop:472 length:384 start_codon:yes stop_codon:yes gene_type:complete